MKKILILLLLMSNLLHAYCYYVSCAPSVSMATALASTNIEKGFLKIYYQLNTTKNLYDKYSDVLMANNNAYMQNYLLKQAYLVELKKISAIQEQIISIKSQSSESKGVGP